jgi:hypothetical protein
MISRQHIFWRPKSLMVDIAAFMKKRTPTLKELWLAFKYSPFILIGGHGLMPSMWSTKLCTKFANPGYINSLNANLKWQWTATAVRTKQYKPEFRELQLECKSKFFEDDMLEFSIEDKRKMQEIKEQHNWKSESCVIGINYAIEENLINVYQAFVKVCIIILAIISMLWGLGDILKNDVNIIPLINKAKVMVTNLISIKAAILFLGGVFDR